MFEYISDIKRDGGNSKKMSISSSWNMSDYFHSDLRREFVEDRLNNEGDFLIRKSNDDKEMCVSVLWKSQYRRITPVERIDGNLQTYYNNENFERRRKSSSSRRFPERIGYDEKYARRKHRAVYWRIVIPETGPKDRMNILLELVSRGSLDKLLRKNKIRLREKLKTCIQAAKGLRYLHKHHHIIHRDLAARNILVHMGDDGMLVAKVSDFGLSLDLVGSTAVEKDTN